MKDTMILGLDVCHKGSRSIVGFCATYNSTFTQYYSSSFVQPRKGQEIVGESMKTEFKRAYDMYVDFNKKEPAHILYYRDGVGDSQRDEVVQSEIKFMK